MEKEKKYKLIIFDLDGTLIDAYKAIERSFNYTMKILGYPKQNSLIIRRAVGWGDKNLLKPFIKKSDLKKALSIYRKSHKKTLLTDSFILPNVDRFLNYLKKNRYLLAIASNRPTYFTQLVLKKLRLNKYFNYVLCADKLKTIKPNPEILLKIIKKFSLEKKDVLYAGDMTVDIKAAKNANIDVVAIKGGSSSLAEIKKEKPLKIFKNILQIKSIL